MRPIFHGIVMQKLRLLSISLLLLAPSLSQAQEWTDILKEGVLAAGGQERQPPLETGMRVDGKELVTFDHGTAEGSFFYISSPIMGDGHAVVVEARVKVVSGLNGISINFQGESISMRLQPEELVFRERRKKISRVTSDDFHTYRITVSAGSVRVEMDDAVILESTATDNGVQGKSGSGEISFGSGNSGQLGEAVWEFVRYRLE